jgi:hypothetical protein
LCVMNWNETLLVLDTALLISVCLLEAVTLTGLPAHEWLAVVFVAMLLVHILLQWPWISSRTRRLLAPRTGRTRLNYCLNLGLFIVMVATIVSGIMISEVVFPAAGRPNIGGIWRSLHGFTTNLVVLFVGLHLGLNGDWILAAVRQAFRPGSSSAPTP